MAKSERNNEAAQRIARSATSRNSTRSQICFENFSSSWPCTSFAYARVLSKCRAYSRARSKLLSSNWPFSWGKLLMSKFAVWRAHRHSVSYPCTRAVLGSPAASHCFYGAVNITKRPPHTHTQAYHQQGRPAIQMASFGQNSWRFACVYKFFWLLLDSRQTNVCNFLASHTHTPPLSSSLSLSLWLSLSCLFARKHLRWPWLHKNSCKFQASCINCTPHPSHTHFIFDSITKEKQRESANERERESERSKRTSHIVCPLSSKKWRNFCAHCQQS